MFLVLSAGGSIHGGTGCFPENRTAPDSSLLSRMCRKIATEKTAVHSILILQNGELCFEEYFNGFERDSLQLTYHVINSVISTLAGICIDNGLIKSVDQPVITFFPEYIPVVQDTLQFRITVKHLLTMTAGYQWESEHHDREIAEFRDNPELSAYLFQCPLAHRPGTVFSQNSGGIYLLIKIIEKVSGKSLPEFMKERLFDPLQITRYKLAADPAGRTKGPYALYLRPYDLIKLGSLFLNGQWNSKQLVSREWMAEAIRPHVRLTPRFQAFRDLNAEGFGYCWWIFPDMFAALGHSGQHLYISQEHAMVVLVTGRMRFIDPAGLYRDYIRPALSVQD